MEKKSPSTIQLSNIDLITFLRFKGFQPLGVPIEDASGVRWVTFEDTPQLKKATLSFITGNDESKLLNEFRRTRSFILDTTPERETR